MNCSSDDKMDAIVKTIWEMEEYWEDKKMDAKNEAWEKGDYEQYFLYFDKHYVLEAMLERWNELLDKYKYEIFCSVYSRIENGFDTIPDEIFEEVAWLRPELPAELLEKIRDGKIYRGDVKERDHPIESTSWTISLKVAEFFSNRFANTFEQTPVVWCGKVDPENVLAYITDRDEEEIVVKRGTVTDILEVPNDRSIINLDICSQNEIVLCNQALKPAV